MATIQHAEPQLVGMPYFRQFPEFKFKSEKFLIKITTSMFIRVKVQDNAKVRNK